jgi:hypothetical protein
VRNRAENHTIAERIYGMLLRLYPRAFRVEYGEQMRITFREWHDRKRDGMSSKLRFWVAVHRDLVPSLSREWTAHFRMLVRERTSEDPERPPYAASALAGLAVLSLYVVTLAPATAFWDAGEYITVAHVLGIAHPPGSPLFSLLAHAWEVLLSPTGLPVAVRVNLFSAALSAASHALWFLVVYRVLAAWIPERRIRQIGAGVAVVLSASAFTVWNQSNVNEKVYGISLFTTALATWLVLRWRDSGRPASSIILIAFVVALSATNHPMGWLVVPALLVFALLVDRRALARPRLWAAVLPVGALALSVHFFLPLRAAQQPLISEGEPVCDSATDALRSVYSFGRAGCEALSAVLSREQYGKPSVLLDPTVYPQHEIPRSADLLASQLVNYLQYFDWQWGRSIGGAEALFGGARPVVTILFLLLGLYGAGTHWKRDRESAAYMGILFLTFSIGLVLYLNFRYGLSIALDRFPDASMHEVRERDYFFLVGFSVWGLWAGVGLIDVWGRIAAAARNRVRAPRLAAAPVLGLAFLPLALNWTWASRADDYTARDWAYNVLMSVQPYGVLVTNGDNDTFPLWYLQEVEGIRQDVTVMVSPYLSTPWYVKQLRELTRPCPPGVDPRDSPTRIVCQRPFELTDLPHALVQAGWPRSAEPPRDSVVPFSDDEIRRLTESYLVTHEPVTLSAEAIEATVEPGTELLPADLVVAAMLKATVGERPIYFMPGSPIVRNLGLWGHTVRHGIPWRIQEGPLPVDPDTGVVPLPESELPPLAAAAVDLPLTDTLMWEVYLRRGRILRPDAPWVDAATTNILAQYAYAHVAAAQASAMVGEQERAERHIRDANWWGAISAN